MRVRKAREAPASPAQDTAGPAKPPWAAMLEDEERPSREDLAAGHNPFTDSILSPVPLPRWLRGRRREREKLS